MLVNGKWTGSFQPVQGVDKQGGFVRQSSRFRHWIGESTRFPVQPDRYHLFVTMICPWACRTLMVRKLKRLEQLISVSVLSPVLTDQGWSFKHQRNSTDPFYGFEYLHQLYSHSDPDYCGRATVPVLWDKQQQCIVNNESADIMRMFSSAFGDAGAEGPELCPHDLLPEIDRLNGRYYELLNNAVYRAGFATTQQAYNEAVGQVFRTLEELEQRLGDRRYLLGERLTETDLRLFVTLIRFDPAYHGLFKCNLKRLQDYPELCRYVGDILTVPGIAETVDIDAIKQGYYSIRSLNPSGIVPQGPAPLLTEV